MKDTDLYQHVLGLREPWSVSKVELDIKAQRVDVWVEHPKDLKWPCPECEVEGALYDHAEERVWRHLDTCQFQTFLHARPPRVNCPEHGVRQVKCVFRCKPATHSIPFRPLVPLHSGHPFRWNPATDCRASRPRFGKG